MTSRNLPRPLRPIQIGVKLQIWLQILEFAVQEILEFFLEFAVQRILEFRRFEKKLDSKRFPIASGEKTACDCADVFTKKGTFRLAFREI